MEEGKIENPLCFLNTETGDLYITYFQRNAPLMGWDKNWVRISKKVYDTMWKGYYQEKNPKQLHELSWKEFLEKALEITTLFYDKVKERYGGMNFRTEVIWKVVAFINEELWEEESKTKGKE